MQEKKSFLARLLGGSKPEGKKSGCCDLQFEELPEEAQEPAPDGSQAKQASPCCCGQPPDGKK